MKFKSVTPFRLKTNHTPIPEQQKAIDKLVSNVKSGVQYQTLLGVTGSGKSLTYIEPVLIYEKINDKFKPYIIEIGRLVESDDFKNKNLFVPSINPDNGLQELKEVIQLTKHKSPSHMYKVLTTCGKEIEVTGDHNFWVIRNGKLSLTKTANILDCDYLPLPRSLEIDNLSRIDSISLLSYVRSNTYFKYQDINSEVDLNELKNKLGYSKYYRVSNKNEGINVNSLDKFKVSGKILDNISLYKKHGEQIQNKICLNDNFLGLLGIYIAEGHTEHNYLLISVHEKSYQEVFKKYLKNLRIRYKERNFNKGDFQISNCLLSDLYSGLCGDNSRNKKLPSWFLQLTNSQLSCILSAYFSGDGTVTKNEIQTSTASKKLASDIGYALLRYGINVRIRRKIKSATNTIKKTKRLYYEIIISGKSNLTKYYNEIGFILKRKQNKLGSIIKVNENTNVDLVPIDCNEFKNLREEIGFTHETLSQLVGCTRSYFSMIENNFRKPSQTLLLKVLSIFKENTNSEELLRHIDRMQNLTEIFCAKVKLIKKVSPTSDFVYDIAVKDNETFLAGMGGMYVHNTFTVANAIEKLQEPTLIISHNKTLAAQLYQEMRDLFPDNAVSYFVSYYDYYQPESYIPSTDTYIEKDSAINDLIDKLRLAATTNLLTRKDVIVVASVSCIYNIGSPNEYGKFAFEFVSGMKVSREQIIDRLLDLQYERSEFGFHRGTFRIRAENIDIYPAYTDDSIRIELEENKIKKVSSIHSVTGALITVHSSPFTLFPAKHFITDPKTHQSAFDDIGKDLQHRLIELKKANKLLEAQRLNQRVTYDLEMIKEIGYVKGIENYSRYFDGRIAGGAPFTLLDYFPEDYLVIVDESHITFPQIRGMYAGDFSKKSTLIDYGFRLPSALDNRPLKFDEFMRRIPNFIALSATPDEWELSLSEGHIVEQLLRPTGIPDPVVEVRPTTNQIKDV